MNARLTVFGLAVCVLFGGATALDLDDLMNPDDVMLRRPAKRPAARIVTKTNVVTQTDYVTKTNVVTQTDYVTKTNVVTQTDYVTKTNVVTQTDYVTKTNVVTQTDYVTNVVVKTDYVTKTNVVVKTTLDDSARKALEAKLAAALAAQKAAEEQAADTARKALAAHQARESAEAAARAADRRAENAREAAEKATAAKEAADKRIAYLMNPEPDERAEKKPAAEASGKKPTVQVKKSAPPAPKKALTGRDAVITSERTDYDRKEGVILFDRNVYVDDEQYQMHADRLFVFLEGTNALKRLVAIGHVSITNEEKSAYCARATYQKKTGRIVMYSNDEIKAHLEDGVQGGSSVTGERITFWLNSEQVEVDRPIISVPGAASKGGDFKKILGK